eukprot:4429912-Alexandrium_andersonii.AAC.1
MTAPFQLQAVEAGWASSRPCSFWLWQREVLNDRCRCRFRAALRGCSGCSRSIACVTAYGWAWRRLWRGSAPSLRACCSPMLRRARAW